MNTPQDHESTENTESSEGVESAESADVESPTTTGSTGETAAADASGDTSIYVRRRRTPALGFWVALAIAVPVVIALIAAPFLDLVDAGSVVNLALLAAVFVGVPLAAVAAAVDAILQRSAARRGR